MCQECDRLREVVTQQQKQEHVVIRKIIGTLRNEKGTSIHETIMTMFATWKQQELNLYTELKARLC